MSTIKISKKQLDEAMRVWVDASRTNMCRTHEETDGMPAADVAKESSDYLWSLLTGVEASPQPAEQPKADK